MNNKESKDEICSSSWMEQLSEVDYKQPLNKLIIPGSHDSFTNNIPKNASVGPDARSLSNIFFLCGGNMAKNFMRDWLITQQVGVLEQLEAGVRYFDIRVGYFEEDYYITHQLYADKLDHILGAMGHFLKRNLKEVILLDFNHVYLDHESHKLLQQKILHRFGSLMLDYAETIGKPIPSLWDMWNRSKQVIVFYHYEDLEPNFWPPESIPSVWPNTTSVEVMQQRLTQALSERDNDTKFLVCQGILTPNAKTIVSHPLSSLQKHLCQPAEVALSHWLVSLSEGQRTRLNIVIADFVTTGHRDSMLGQHLAASIFGMNRFQCKNIDWHNS